jgi:hypothetical protein
MSQQLPPTLDIDCDTFTGDIAFWQDLFRQHCDIRRDHDAFVGGQDLDDAAFATHFDGLRRVYPERLEYDRFSLNVDATAPASRQLRQLGFQLARG